MLEQYDDAILACEESILLARACGYVAGVTRAQVVQCEILLGMVEKDEQNQSNADKEDHERDFKILTRIRAVGENLLETEKSKKKLKAGDIARALFIVARIYMAIVIFAKATATQNDAALSKNITMEGIVALLKESKEMFESANDTSWIKQVVGFAQKHGVQLEWTRSVKMTFRKLVLL